MVHATAPRRRCILLVDDNESFRESIGDALRLRGFDVNEAEGVPSALVQLARTPPDLALVDICLPDYDGIEFLRMMNARQEKLQIPVILMTAQPKREYLEAATRLGICDFVVKASFSVQELVNRIELRLVENPLVPAPPLPPIPPISLAPSPGSGTAAAVRPPPAAPSSLRPTSSYTPRGESSASPTTFTGKSTQGPISTTGPVSNFDIREEMAIKRRQVAGRNRLFHGLDARALPGPVAEILELAASMTTSLPQLEAVVRRDPVLAARIFSLANSAAHQGARPVGSLEEALRNVGIDAVVEMVATLPLVEPEALRGPSGRDLSSLWWHCLATAVVCDRLAPGPVRAGAYLAGIFHDLPLLFGMQVLGEEWNELRTRAVDEGKAISEAVPEAFGMVPGQMAQEVFTRYKLPEPLSGPLRDYHNICLGRQPREPGDLARRVDAAHNLALALGWTWSDLAEIRPIAQDETRGWREVERLVVELPQIAQEIERLGAMAGLPRLDDENVDLPSWGERKIAYWRDPRYRVPDPIEHVLARSGLLESMDSPEAFAAARDVRKVAAVEPDSVHWRTILATEGPVTLLHRTALPGFSAPPGIRALRMPVAICQLRKALA